MYAGSDLYFGLRVAQLAGNHPNIYVHNRRLQQRQRWHGERNATRIPRPANPQSISVHLACDEYNPTNSDAYDQYYDAGKNMGRAGTSNTTR